MNRLNAFAPIGAALVIGGAGILGWIDQTTMIVLIIVLIICMPNGCSSCAAGGRP